MFSTEPASIFYGKSPFILVPQHSLLYTHPPSLDPASCNFPARGALTSLSPSSVRGRLSGLFSAPIPFHLSVPMIFRFSFNISPRALKLNQGVVNADRDGYFHRNWRVPTGWQVLAHDHCNIGRVELDEAPASNVYHPAQPLTKRRSDG
jgi:hypothetical protein